MGLSKVQKISILLAIDISFFILEITVGYAVHSLALVADAFHMFNDILSLLVGLWAVKVATKGERSNAYTYGWQRAETIGALVNGVFLVALCVTIILEAIQRFLDPPEINNPKLVLIVGCAGLVSNLLGLVLFHEHGHSHGHGHDHSHASPETLAEEGQAHSHSHDESSRALSSPDTAMTVKSAGNTIGDLGKVSRRTSSTPGRSSASREGGRRSSAKDIPTFPRGIRDHAGSLGEAAEVYREEEEAVETRDGQISREVASERSPLSGLGGSNYGSTNQPAKQHDDSHGGEAHSHGASGHGHSHGDLNMRGILLHVMGDALGNIGVIGTALFIWKTDYAWRFYADPLISLVITVIILCSAIPLCRATSRILLQAVPSWVDIEAIQKEIEKLDNIVSCHHLHVWQLTDTKLVASLHVQIEFKPEDGDDSVQPQRSRELYMILVKQIHNLLHRYGIANSTIQPEFCTDANHRHLTSRSSGEQTITGDADADAAEACLFQCDASCGNSINGQCCDPVTVSGNTLPSPSAETGSAPPHSHEH